MANFGVKKKCAISIKMLTDTVAEQRTLHFVLGEDAFSRFPSYFLPLDHFKFCIWANIRAKI